MLRLQIYVFKGYNYSESAAMTESEAEHKDKSEQ